MQYRDLIAYLYKETKKVDEQMENDELTADKIASHFGIKRNTVSNQCNVAVKNGDLVKIQTRPVYFLHKESFTESFFAPGKIIYDSWRELWSEKPNSLHQNSTLSTVKVRSLKKNALEGFEEIIGYNGSLKKAIEQLKVSFLYPTNRLPVILTGPTGVGKTFLATMVYKYAVNNKILPEKAPFIVFNCAQYADNPELLSSNLFGHVKGAFTGANNTTKGMIEVADGGVLFLDEVHRLNWENQEKLFTLMDQGRFRRVGESEEWHKVNVRLIMATTENLYDTFLETFLRRIPIQIQIPPLWKRGFNERLKMIYHFFIQESCVINKDLSISGRVIDALLYLSSRDNIGNLKNQIKLICATSYMRFPDKNCLKINLIGLPENDFKKIADMHKINLHKSEDIYITPKTELSQIYQEHTKTISDVSELLSDLDDSFNMSIKTEQGIKEFEQKLFDLINDYFNNLLYLSSQDNQNTVIQFITSSIIEISQYMKHHYNMKFKGNSIYAIATYLYTRNNNYEMKSNTYKGLDNYIENHCKQQNKLAKKILETIKIRIDINLIYEDECLFTLYLKSQFQKSSKLRTQCIILAHGYATASSIANAVNQLIGENIIESFDMPIDSKSQDVINYVRKYIEQTDISEGLVILVDMGSLQEVYLPLKNLFQGPVLIINNVSTQLALEVGLMIQQQNGVDNIIDNIKQNCEPQFKMIYPENQRPICLLSCCITGIGGSKKINELLQRSIPKELNVMVVNESYEELRHFKEKHHIFQLYEVKGIVGTVNPRVGNIPYIPLDELISGKAISKLQECFSSIATIEQLDKISNDLVAELSVERLIGQLTILYPQKVVKQVDECINRFIEMTGYTLSVSKRAGIYFHVSCMIERLIRNQPIDVDVDVDEQEDELLDNRNEVVHFVEKAFASIENYYNLHSSIPEEEWLYITNIIVNTD